MEDQVVTIKLSKKLKEYLVQAAAAHNMNRGRYIKRALIMMLIREGYGEDKEGNDTMDKLLL